MCKIFSIKPAARSNGKPPVLWTIAVSTVAVVFLMLDNPLAEAQADETGTHYTQWELPTAAKARLGKGGINALQFSPDGTQLAVGSTIGVWLYDVATGKALSLFPGRCESLAFSPDGRFLANGGGDPDSSLGGSPLENGLELWEITTGRKVPLPDTYRAAKVLRFSGDGKTLVSLRKSRDIISRLDIGTGKRTVTHLGKRPGYVHLEVYALTEDKIAIGAETGKIEVWDTWTGKKLSTLREHEEKILLPGRMWEENNCVFAVAFSPDGTKLASGSLDTTVQLWDTTGGDEPIFLQKHTGRLTVLAFSPDGKILASGSSDKTVQLWDTATGESLNTLIGHLSDIDALAFSPDGATLASGSADGTVQFWNSEVRNFGMPQIPSVEKSTRITGHTPWLNTATFFKESATLASVAYNGIITLWDLKTFKATTRQTRTTFESTLMDWNLALSFAFSPDGTQLASGGFKNNPTEPPQEASPILRLTDVRTGRALKTFPISGSDLTFSPDGKTLAGSRSNSIRLWNIETGKHLDISLSDPNDASGMSHPPIISTLAFSPDGKKIANGTMGGKVQMWDATTGSAVTSFFEGQPPIENRYRERITTLAFSSDSSLIAVGSMKRTRVLGNMKQIRLNSGFLPLTREGVSHGDDIWSTALLFSPANTTLLIGLSSGKIELWNLTTGSLHTTLDGHTDSVHTLAFSQDNKTLVSASADGTILLWDWDEVLIHE